MRRRHFLVVGEDRGLCGRNLGENPLVDRGVTNWRQVDCLQCQVKRYLRAKKEHDKRKARELARARRPVPLLEDNVDKFTPDTPIDNTRLHQALAMQTAEHTREKLETFTRDLEKARDCGDCPEEKPDLPPPGEIVYVPNNDLNVVLHRLEGLEAQLSNLQCQQTKIAGLLARTLADVQQLAKESQSREGYIQTMIGQATMNILEAMQANRVLKMVGHVETFFGERTVELTPRTIASDQEPRQ